MDRNQGENTYLQQVLQEKAEVDRKLSRRAPPPAAPQSNVAAIAHSVNLSRAIDYRITGFWIWKSVIVPPNVYTVHTRRGHNEPLHIGKGISFRFNPLTDAFLVIPAAVQTILINANCICVERQGIYVQAYVQWIIDDIQTAYWKLDFSDPEEPMGLVNVQLREQAEAAIKDKVATLSIDEVLSDKQPIIEELTHRLQTVAEGSRNEGDRRTSSEGLGLKIVTVQIKEAVVSSTQLWQNLQTPFRAEREKLARLAQLESEQEITNRELANRLSNERDNINVASEIEQLQSEQACITYDREQTETLRRDRLEQDAARQILAEQNRTALARNQARLDLLLQELDLEKQRITAEIEKVQQQLQLDAVQAEKMRAEVSAELEVAELRNLAEVAQSDRQLELDRKQREIENEISQSNIQARLIAQLPEIAKNLPAPQEQRTTIITSDTQEGMLNSLLGFLAGLSNLTPGIFKRDNTSSDS
jgi:flotillin